jgi:subfamily B ATP-binding cassette protein MsbA
MQSSPDSTDSAKATASSSTATPSTLLGRLRRLARYFGLHRAAWALAVAATIVAAITEPLIPAMMKPLLDRGFTEGRLSLWVVPLAVMGIFAIRGMAQFASQYALAQIANEGMIALRRDLFHRLLRAEMALFTRQSASSLSNTVVYEVQTGATLVVQALLGLSRDGFTMIALLGYLLWLNWQLTLVVGIVIPGVAWIMKTLSRRLYQVTKASQQATDDLAYVVEENVLAHRMVRLHGAQPVQQGRFDALSTRLRRLAIKSTVASAAMTPLTQLLAAGALSAVIVIALWQGRIGDDPKGVTVGGFVAFITAMLMLIAPIRRLAEITNPVTRGVAALERGLSLLGEVRIETGGDWKPVAGEPSASPLIEWQDVQVAYREGTAPALDGLSLSVRQGDVVAFVGPSGSGKTTLVNLLPRFVLPSGGAVRVCGHDVSEWDIQTLRDQFAMVSQDVVMFNDTVAANVAMGQPQDRERLQRCLEDANLAEHVAAMPHGMDTLVGHNAAELSGGQRQRLAIARALYKNAPILILDEATSALDTGSERLVQQALQRVMKGRTTLVVAHRLSTIEHADRVVVMQHGHIVEQGSHAELLKADGLYARLHTPAGIPQSL